MTSLVCCRKIVPKPELVLGIPYIEFQLSEREHVRETHPGHRVRDSRLAQNMELLDESRARGSEVVHRLV